MLDGFKGALAVLTDSSVWCTFSKHWCSVLLKTGLLQLLDATMPAMPDPIGLFTLPHHAVGELGRQGLNRMITGETW